MSSNIIDKNPVKMPALFVGHGSPMNAIEENDFTSGFRKIAGKIPNPAAILCISAHWFINGTKLTAMDYPETIHDFYGFPPELYEVKYPAKGNPALADEVRQLLPAGIAALDQTWGLDHGTWSVLKHMYPDADIPVVQLSIDKSKPADYHYELASNLSKLREKGILILGSGNIIHNLGLVDFRNIDKDNYGFDWAVEAREKLNLFILNGNHKSLVEFEKQGSSVKLAVPTPDHYLPLIYILGLQSKNESVELFNDKLAGGSLSMTSLIIKNSEL